MDRSPALDRPAEVAYPGSGHRACSRRTRPHDWAWRLLYVGRLDQRKGIDTAIEALARAAARGRADRPGLGRRPLPGELRALCRRARPGGAGHASTPARASELPAAYAAPTRCCSRSAGRSPGGWSRWRRWRSGTPVVATGTGGSARVPARRGRTRWWSGRSRGPRCSRTPFGALAAEPGLRDTLREGGQETAARFTERGYNEAIEEALKRALA